MSGLQIQIWRGDNWNCLTTVRVTATGPADEAAARKRAERDAKRQLSGWASHFPMQRLRVAEVS